MSVCDACGSPAPAGVCAGPHPGLRADRYIERRYLAYESWAAGDNGTVERVNGEEGVMTVVRGSRTWVIHGDLDVMLRRLARGDQSTPAHHAAELRRAMARIERLAARYGLEVDVRLRGAEDAPAPAAIRVAAGGMG